VVGSKGEEVVDALDEGALEDGPLPAEERHHHQRRHRPVHHQQPRHLHPAGDPHALAWGPPLPSLPANLVDTVKGNRSQTEETRNLLC